MSTCGSPPEASSDPRSRTTRLFRTANEVRETSSFDTTPPKDICVICGQTGRIGGYPETKGFEALSRPIVVSGPWPQTTRVSSGRV